MSKILSSRIKLFILSILVVGIFGLVGSLRAVNNSVFSVSAWVKPSASVASKAIMGKAEEMRIATDASGHPLCQIKASTWQTAVVSSAVIAVNQWSHIVCSYDRNSFKIFIDGELKGTQALTATADDTSAQWLIGRDASASTPYGYFSGLVDAYKFYNYALSESEVKTLYNGSAVANMGAGTSRNNNGTTVTGENMDYCVPGDTARCDKPVLELKFDEKQGSTAFDTSGNGSNGALANGPVWDRGKVGSSLSFNGVGGEVRNIPNVNIQGNFTISAWIKPETLTGERAIFFSRSNFFVLQTSDILRWMRAGNNCLVNGSGVQIDTVSSEAVVTKDEWQYVTFVSDAINNKIYIYRNGKAVVDQAGKSDCPTDASTDMVGSTDSRWFDGNIDEVRIYDYARTPAQIAWDYNRGKPINEWRFDEGAGTVVHDQGPNRNNGTITGAVWKSGNECNKGSAQGSAEEKCLYFDGLNTTRVDADTQDNMDSFTVCAWAKAKAWTNSDNDLLMFIFNKGWEFSLLNNGKLRLYIPTLSSYPHFETESSLETEKWHRLCAVYAGLGQTSYIYIDGSEQRLSYSFNGDGIKEDDSSYFLRIGAQHNNSYYGNFYGYIDDPKIYNYALTAEQIKLDYNGGAVGFR